jgi:hypothetical protein
MRKTYTLSPSELVRFNRLRPEQGEGWTFWQEMGDKLGFDYATVMTTNPANRGTFTALPKGHEKDWCFPSALKCKNDPPPVSERDSFR